MKKLITLSTVVFLAFIWMGCSSSSETESSSAVMNDLPDSTYSTSKTRLQTATTSLNLADSLISTPQTSADSTENLAKTNKSRISKMIREADVELSFIDRSLEGLNSEAPRFKEIRKESDLLHVKVITLTDKAGLGAKKANYAKRRLIVPGEEWNFDQAPEITTDPRVNAVVAFKEQSYQDKDFEFRSIKKDSLVFDFKMYRDWIPSEKMVGKVISYNDPTGAVIITMNNSTAQFDSLNYWTAIYEASAYGKNQLPSADQHFSKDRLEALGADQSYLARYHVANKEIAAVFLQKQNKVVSVFVEYPNGFLTSDDADLINEFLNYIKFR